MSYYNEPVIEHDAFLYLNKDQQWNIIKTLFWPDGCRIENEIMVRFYLESSGVIRESINGYEFLSRFTSFPERWGNLHALEESVMLFSIAGHCQNMALDAKAREDRMEHLRSLAPMKKGI